MEGTKPTPSFRRALLLTVPLVLVLAACQNKAAAPPDLGDTNQEIEQLEGLVEPYTSPCPDISVPPCSDGTGCIPANGTIISDGPPYEKPGFSWTYNCNPDAHNFNLYRQEDDYPLGYPTHELPGSAKSYNPSGNLKPGHYVWHIWGVWDAEVMELLGTPLPPIPGTEIEGGMASGFFWVGSMCHGPEEIAPPVDLSPDHLVYSSEPSLKVPFRWWYSLDLNCLPDHFVGEIAEDESFTTNVMNIVSGPGLDQWGESKGMLERCHEYYWRVRGMLGDEPGPWSYTYDFSIAPPGGMEACPGGSIAVGAVSAIAAKNAACRIGPGTAYAIGTYVPAGERHAVDGRNADGTWLRLRDLACYINRELLTLEVGGTPFPGGADVGDLMSALPVLPDPPLPTVPPMVCKPTMGQAECEATGGKWVRDMSVVGAPIYKCDCP